jgi:hypothetical protein
VTMRADPNFSLLRRFTLRRNSCGNHAPYGAAVFQERGAGNHFSPAGFVFPLFPGSFEDVP